MNTTATYNELMMTGVTYNPALLNRANNEATRTYDAYTAAYASFKKMDKQNPNYAHAETVCDALLSENNKWAEVIEQQEAAASLAGIDPYYVAVTTPRASWIERNWGWVVLGLFILSRASNN